MSKKTELLINIEEALKMKKSSIVIKFNKDVIQSRTNESLTLKTFVTQDNFLTFSFYQNKMVSVNLVNDRKFKYG